MAAKFLTDGPSVCLCGAAFLPRRLAIAAPLTALLGTDVVLNAHYHRPIFTVEFLGTVVVFATVVALGWQLRRNARPAVILPAALCSSLFFYVATNTASWLSDKDYAKTIAGWVQAITTGLPGYPPTWTFYRNTLAADVIFTALFLLCIRASKPAPRAAIQTAGATR